MSEPPQKNPQAQPTALVLALFAAIIAAGAGFLVRGTVGWLLVAVGLLPLLLVLLNRGSARP